MSKKVLIVGGSSGLGRQLAELYAAEGCKVGIIGRRENLLIELQERFPEQIVIKKADIADDTINAALHDLISNLDGVDIIIAAASVINFNTDLNPALEEETIAVNVKGYTNVVTTAWNYFKEKGSGQIVGITSIAAARGNKMAPAYHASKSFQSIYLESLRVKSKFEKNTISITELIPGYIDTAMGKGDRMFWVSSLSKAGSQAKKAIDKKRQRAFISKRWWFVYHIQRFLPIFIYDSVVNGSWKLKRKK
jgi:short-subunit dehydrogenase